MKWAVTIAKYVVGFLFIISGLVKANDPLGLSYKMQEFFDVWTSDVSVGTIFFKTPLLALFSFLSEHALALSVVMITLEIMAGIALLIGWRKSFVLKLLLILIIFFTFLTGYAFSSGKFKNCGCFGDCLPISPLTSFLKDLVLLSLILLLLFSKKYIQSAFTKQASAFVLAAFLLLSIGVQWYVLRQLPFADCLPFKKGASIIEGLKAPPGAVPDSFAIQFVYEKAGKKYDFSPENLPANLSTYKFIERKDKLIRKGNAEPAIKGFVLSGVTDVDSTAYVLAQPHAVLYFYETETAVPTAIKENLKTIYKAADAKQIPVYVVTTSLNKIRRGFENEDFKNVQFLTIDFTAFRTAARTNPCIYFLQSGVIKEKRSEAQSDKILKAISNIQ